MTNIKNTSSSLFPIKCGLPRSICVEPGGFKRLNNTLRIARKQRKAILKSSFAQDRTRSVRKILTRERMRAGERDRKLLLALYSDPVNRYDLWEKNYKLLEQNQNNDERSNNLIPSLEYLALSDLISKFRCDELNKSIIENAFSEWPELVDRISDAPPWAQFAAAAWIALNEKIKHWGNLSDKEKPLIGIQVFSVATIVNDVRLLSTVAEQVKWLNDEFVDLLDHDESTAEVIDIENPDGTRTSCLREQWSQHCKSLASAATEAGGPNPDLDVLTKIGTLVSELEKIVEPLRHEMESPQYSDLVAYLDSQFSSVKNELCFKWLDENIQNELIDLWKKRWGSFSREEASDVFENLQSGVTKTFKRVRRSSTRLDTAKSALQSLGTEPSSNFKERHLWEEKKDRIDEKMLKCKRKIRNAENSAYQALKPPLEKEHEIDSDAREKKNDLNSQVTSENTTTSTDTSTFTDESQNGISDEEILVVDKDLPTNQTDSVTGSVIDESTSQHSLFTTRITEALTENPPRIAYSVQLARLAQKLGELPPEFPLAALEASLYSNYLRFPDGKIATALRKIFEDLKALSEIDVDTKRDIYALMTLSATLRPSLLAPQSGALGFLSDFQTSNLEAVYYFAKNITEKAQLLQGNRIDSSILGGTRSEASWENEYTQLREDAEAWRQQALHMTMLYGPATNVWKNWQRPDGLLGRLITMVISPDRTKNGEIETKINQIEDRKSFEELVRKTDRKELKRRHGEDIHARALDQLHNHALQVLDIFRKKLLLENTRPSESDFLTATLNDLRMAMEESAPEALSELNEIARGNQSLLSGAANLAAYAINRFQLLFNPDHIGIDREPNPEQIISSGLFNYCEISISPEGIPESEPNSSLGILLNTPTPDSYENAFTQRLEKGDLETSRNMLDWIEKGERGNVEKMRNQFKYALSEKTDALRRSINDVREKVESALALGYLPDSDRNRHDAEIVSLERLCSENKIYRFDQAHKILSDIQEQLHHSLNSQKEKAQNDLSNLNLDHDEEQYQLVLDTIQQDDIVTANELIDRIRDGESVISKNIQPRFNFCDFFPNRIKDIDRTMEKERNISVINRIQRGQNFAGLNFGRVTGARRESAARMLTAWRELKRAGTVKSDTPEKLREIFSELGFRVLSVKLGKQDRVHCKVELKTEPIEDRDLCPIPAYGSNAAGNYRIVVLWGRPTVEDILQFADDRSLRKATIVLFMGRLREENRREVAQITRNRTRNLLVIDENLLVFLCSETDSRIPTLFACTLPFTYVQPYVTTAGLLPPEMFYGREREMQEVADPAGPCFIYGGRQLGKTALLRAVERKVHMPSEGHYALWMDLKGEGIGYDRGPSEIWPALWRSLRNINAVSKEVSEPNPNIKGRVDGFINHLRSHFSKNSGRTLMLLLDEADRFLEVDAREEDVSGGATGYRESTRLKSLMDSTERSVKVIFAGLHNVLRTVKYSNHPLGHFGEPIQIGPLLSDGAWRSAEALLREPMLASGYTFDPPTLITRVLAQTNYYPSLIQLYGSALIKAMVPQHTRKGPLYSISEDVLDQTYQSRNLRDMIRSRFQLTLQLDPRYEVIAYAIAYYCLNQDSALMDGLDQKQIDDAARGWWPEGFREIETGTDRFRSLLDEMVGLGVLRYVGQKRYTLRNPNLLLLMGSEEEIDDNLLRTRELPQEFEPELFRARNPLNPDGHTRSPLTFQQESSLRLKQNGVTVLCGFAASGLKDVLPFLQARGSEDQVVDLKDLFERRDFENKLKRLGSDRKEGTTIYVVTQDVPWSEHWVEAALKRMSKLHAKGRYAHVLFLSDAKHLWQLYTELEKLNKLGLRWLSLRSWREEFLRQWMEDVGFDDNPDTRLAITKTTGLWSGLIMQLYELKQKHGEIGIAIEKLEETVNPCPEGSLQDDFGIGDPDSRRVLRPLAIFGEANFEDLLDEVSREGIEAHTLRLRLNWAERLHLIRSHGKDRWEFDSIAAKLIP